MAEKDDTKTTGKTALTREGRLKSALKANLARRKAQNRKRAQLSGKINKPPDSSGKGEDA